MNFTTDIYIVNGRRLHRKIRLIKGVVIKTRKWSWAVDFGGKRHLLGATAFFTRASAERDKHARLLMYVKNDYIRRYKPELFGLALRLLDGPMSEY